MKRAPFLFLCSMAIVACTSREDGPADAGTDAALDGGATDAQTPDGGVDASVDAPPDAGCALDCPSLPEGCYYVDQDCESETCGTPMCPDPEDLCGGLFHGLCPSTEWCDFVLDGACGTLDETGVCRPRPASCDTTCVEVCGCDGTTYCNACEAQRAGRDVAHEGPCAAPDPCRGHDAWGEGGDTTVLGWKWSGVACEAVIGTVCTGTDCALLEPDEPACQTAYADCIAALCDAQDAAATGTCDADVGWAWDGDACVLLRGCSCEGTECWRIEGTAETDCQSEFARCVPAPT